MKNWRYKVYLADREDGFGGTLDKELDALAYFNREVISVYYDPRKNATVIIARELTDTANNESVPGASDLAHGE